MSGIPDSIREVAVAWGDAHDWFIEDKVKLAQDILEATDKSVRKISEQQAITFAEWITDNHYSRATNDRWRITRSISEVEKTTPELYQLFLQSQSK